MCNVPFVKFCSEMASEGIVANINKGEKLDGENYNIWYRKMSNTNVVLLPMKVDARRICVRALQC